MTKRKHPSDRAERLKINEEKKAGQKRKGVKGVPEGSSDSVLSDREDI